MKAPTLVVFLVGTAAAVSPVAQRALNEQDRPALEKIASESTASAAKNAGNFEAQMEASLYQSMLSQLAIEVGDKPLGRSAAEAGMGPARRAVSIKPNDSEAHRLLGTLCGQVIPANPLSALKYGRCAMDEVKQALALDQKSSKAWLSRGVGNYYLPEAFGGSVQQAIQDFDKAIQLDPKSAEAHLWRGIALRKSGNNAEARKAIERSLKLNPDRKWAKQQLDKTPQ